MRTLMGALKRASDRTSSGSFLAPAPLLLAPSRHNENRRSMPSLFRRKSHETTPKPLHEIAPRRGFKKWIDKVFHSSKAPANTKQCTCRRRLAPLRTKTRVYATPVTVTIPIKYMHAPKKTHLVSGHLVPFTPLQVSNWKDLRRTFGTFATIEEERSTCDYCQCKSNVTRDSLEDDDDEY